jgi:hypothetical protein
VENIQKFIDNRNNIIFILFPIVFISIYIAIRLWQFGHRPEPWIFGDWLINYGAGFIRRGLSGEALILIRDLFGFEISLIYFLINIFLYLYIFRVICQKYWNHTDNFIFFLFIAPISIYFYLYDSNIIGRKDVLFIFYLSAIYKFYNKRVFNVFLYSLFFWSILSSLLILTHESFYFYLFLLLAIVLIRENGEPQIFFSRACAFLTLPTLTFLTVFYHQSTLDIGPIIERIPNFAVAMSEGCIGEAMVSIWSQGAICYLRNDVVAAYGQTVFSVETTTLLTYIVMSGFQLTLVTGLSIWALSPLNKYQCMLLAGGLLAVLPLFSVALDWGRWLHVLAMTFLIFVPIRKITFRVRAAHLVAAALIASVLTISHTRDEFFTFGGPIFVRNVIEKFI